MIESTMIIEKGTDLLLEYDPGMYRKVTVQAVIQYGAKDRRIAIVGMTASFNADGLERQYSRWFRRMLHPFDAVKIEETKIEKHRRGIVKMLQETDWTDLGLDRLEEIKAIMSPAEWAKIKRAEQ